MLLSRNLNHCAETSQGRHKTAQDRLEDGRYEVDQTWPQGVTANRKYGQTWEDANLVRLSITIDDFFILIHWIGFGLEGFLSNIFKERGVGAAPAAPGRPIRTGPK